MANNNAIYFSRELEFYLSVCDRMRGSYIHEKQSYVRFSTLNARVPLRSGILVWVPLSIFCRH